MQEVIFDVETITPLFLAGADQETAELRAPSFRGVMRYWGRAAAGSTAKDTVQRIKQAKTEESITFGTTSQGSPIIVKVSMPNHEPNLFAKQKSEIVNGKWQVTGRDYLLWSMAESGKQKKSFSSQPTQMTSKGREVDNYKPPRRYYPEGTRFSVILSVRGKEGKEIEALQRATAAFWLLIQLGGIGSRSRRCAGSLQVIDVHGNQTSLQFTPVTNVRQLEITLKGGISYAQNLWHPKQNTDNDSIKGVTSDQGSFDVISIPNLCRIWILTDNGRPWRSANNAMRDIGNKLQAYRSSISQPNYQFAQRSTFGLPLISRNLADGALKKALEDNRRASPLLLRITKLQGEQYVGIAVLFKTEVVSIRHLPMPDYSLIEQWIGNSFPQALEVTL